MAGGRPDCSAPGQRTLHRQQTVGGPPWWVPVPLLMAALVAYVGGLALLMVAAPDLAHGIGYGPDQLGAVHLLGLAFLSVAIAGSMMQLVPVLLRVRVARPVVAGPAALLLAVGAWMLAIGLWRDAPPIIAAGGSLAVLGGMAIATAVLVAVARAWRGGGLMPTGVGIALSTTWFVLVLVLGVLIAEDRSRHFLTIDHMRLIQVHGVAAVAGWAGGMILALSLNLAPMFSLSHGYRRGPGHLAIGVWHAGVLMVVVGLVLDATPLALAGAIVSIVGAGLALQFAIGVFRHRRRRLEAPMGHLLLGLGCALGALVLVPAAWVGPGITPTVQLIALVLGLIGLGCGVTAGHLFKIVPMLVWTGRFAQLAGTPGAPKLSDLYPARLARAEQAAFIAGLALLLAGLATHSGALAVTGAGALLASGLLVLAAALATLLHRVPPTPPSTFSTDVSQPVTTWRNA